MHNMKKAFSAQKGVAVTRKIKAAIEAQIQKAAENYLAVTFDGESATPVRSIYEAAHIVAKSYLDEMAVQGMGGASNCPRIKVLHPTKGCVAIISYNLRVWEAKGYPSKFVEITEFDDRMWMNSDQLNDKF